MIKGSCCHQSSRLYQIVIVPIFKNDEEKAQTIEAARKLKTDLIAGGFRVIVDEREGQSPGFKFNDWEMRGVPLRIELGPKDLAKQSVMLARRDKPGREGKAPGGVGWAGGNRRQASWGYSGVALS